MAVYMHNVLINSFFLSLVHLEESQGILRTLPFFPLVNKKFGQKNLTAFPKI